MSEYRKKRGTLLKIMGIAALLVVAGFVALPFVIDANQFRPTLESQLTGALGRAVKVGNLKISLWSGSIAADDLSIADDPRFSATPFVRARSLRVGVEMKPLIFSRTVNVTSIALDNPEVTLVRTPSGDWNFSTLASGTVAAPAKNDTKGKEGGDPGVNVLIGTLAITNGRATIVRADRRLKPYLFEKVEITAKNISFTSVFPFALTATVPGGGSAKLEGKAGPLHRSDLSLTPLEISFNLAHFDPVGSGFVDASSGLGGLLDFECNLASDGREVRVKGRAGVDRLQLVKAGSPANRPVGLDWALRHDLKNQTGVLEDSKVSFGNAVAHLGGQYDLRREALNLKMKLHGDGLPVQDLEALLPAVGIVLPRGASLQGGTLSVNADTDGPIDNLVSTGNVDLSGTRLTGYDLGRQLATVAALVGIKTGPSTDIEKLAGDVRMTPAEIKVSGFKLIAPSLGQMTGDGVVGSNRSLDFKMIARLIPSGGLAGGLARLTGSGNVTVPFFVRGTTEDPKFVPDVKGAAGTLLNSPSSKEEGSLGGVLKNLFGKKK
jgi:AsmA protein